MIFLFPYRLTYDFIILAKNYHTKSTGATICYIGYPTNSPIQELCLCWPLRLDTPCTWNYYPSHLSRRRDVLKLSCLLTQTLMPLENIANLNDAIIVI